MNTSATTARTLPAAIRQSCQQYASQLAIVDGDYRASYAQLLPQIEQAASALIALGVAAGDRVAVWAPNTYEWIVAACGIHMAGAVLVPINTRMKGMEANDILERSGCKALLSVGDFLGNYYPDMLADGRPACLQTVVVLRQAPKNAGELSWEQFLASGTADSLAQVPAREAAIAPDSMADLMFTSGTTGKPKGVKLGHEASIRTIAEWARVVGLVQGDHFLIINPFFHTFGYKAGWLAALLHGATIYPHQVFDAASVLQRIQDEKITFLPGPPTLFLTMLAHDKLGDYDISSLNATVTGAATVPPVLIAQMRDVLGFKKVTTAYGQTECSGFGTLCDPGDSVETVATYCGKALPGTEIKIVDEAGNTLPAGENGELLIKGFNVMLGYLDDEQATAETIKDGWLHTGDVGVLNEQGYLRITDRLKDMFIVGGFNCYPAEIERLLADHPSIAQVAVVGIPDERMGEVGVACIVPKAGASFDAKELLAWSRANMANYKVPRHFVQMESLPLNAAGKVLKKDLRQQMQTQLT